MEFLRTRVVPRPVVRDSVKPALRSRCTCDGCMGYWAYEAYPGTRIKCCECGEKFSIVHYGHVICPHCKTNVYCEDDLAYERERERVEQRKLYTGDGRENMKVPIRRDRLL